MHTKVQVPTEGEKVATANVLRNIREIMKRGLFFGENAGYVAEAIKWIENVADDLAPQETDEANEDGKE